VRAKSALSATNRRNAVFIPPQPPVELAKLFSASDVFVLPSRSESFGIVYLESLLHGTPIVGFKPVVDEITRITGTKVGEAFDATTESPADLSKKIMRVLGRSFSRQGLRKAMISGFSWDALWKEYDRMYSAVLKGSHERA
jgi:glycosyltransferase involved in cell wall biosynthesis